MTSLSNFIEKHEKWKNIFIFILIDLKGEVNVKSVFETKAGKLSLNAHQK